MRTQDGKSLKDLDLNITKEFIAESIKHAYAEHRKKGGPYNKNERIQRRNEVFRLHFEYGYSAIKIAEMMKINRNTINGDIQYWYSQVGKKWYSIDPVQSVVKQLEILELQKSRIRQELDKITDSRDRIVCERLIFDIDSKITQISLKLKEAGSRNHELATTWLNNWMKKNKKDDRYMTWFDVIRLSKNAHDRVNKIIEEDRRNYSWRTR